MLRGSVFKKFVEASPVSSMVQGTLERIFDPTKVQQVFDDNAVRQDTKELTFDQCLGIMSDVVFQVTPSVGAWYQHHGDTLDVTRQAVYDKLKHLELPISPAWCVIAMRNSCRSPKPWASGRHRCWPVIAFALWMAITCRGPIIAFWKRVVIGPPSCRAKRWRFMIRNGISSPR